MKHSKQDWLERTEILKGIMARMHNPRIIDIQAETGWSLYVASETKRRYLILIGVIPAKVSHREMGSSCRADASGVCHQCGHPPTPRDCHRLSWFRGKMLCSDCLLVESDMPEGRPVRHVPDAVKVARFRRIVAGEEPAVKLSLTAHVGALPKLEAHEKDANLERWED